eukprot:9019062-Alexandrium_andersonii.AAC.1
MNGVCVLQGLRAALSALHCALHVGPRPYMFSAKACALPLATLHVRLWRPHHIRNSGNLKPQD